MLPDTPINLIIMMDRGVGQPGDGVAGVQWLLQPRGSRRVRGPEHFQRSVRDGVRLADYEDVLGDDAAELGRIFPDGTARLWGATPPKQPNHHKAKALRGRRIGDEVLFYAERTFIARATVQGVLHNRALARKVWGVNDEGDTWEHIVALGDVVEFTSDAVPLLTELGIPEKLWSLMLLPAPDRLRLRGLVDIPSGRQPETVMVPTPRRPRKALARVPELGRQDLLQALGALCTASGPQGSSLCKPLTLLWAIGRLVAQEDRLAPWEIFESEVGALLTEFGRTGSRAAPQYPFCHLRSSGLWEVEGVAEGADATPTALRATGAKAGFIGEAARLLRRASVRAEAVNQLCATYVKDEDRARLLGRVGLGGFLRASGGSWEEEPGGAAAGPVDRRATSGMSPVRDQELVKAVKNLYGHTCQVCSEPLEVPSGYYSEAAHIQGLGTPHDGPDTLANLLCLCPNHHAQFDRLALYIDADWKVCRARDGVVLSALERRAGHAIGEEYVEYHRLLVRRSP
ncbi:HNH endonuclease [Streptomyces sp. NPDC051567]|uniref:HNH endonuclease n=1 Tax=Streptomyces sp. NPDC051567 TaxID=3365660 RepID=UPI0037B69704